MKKYVYIVVTSDTTFGGQKFALCESFDHFVFSPIPDDFEKSFLVLLDRVDTFVRDEFKKWISDSAPLFKGFRSDYFLAALYSALEVVHACSDCFFAGSFQDQACFDSDLHVFVAFEDCEI